MKKLNSIFLAGLFVIIPIAITFYILYIVVRFGDNITAPLLQYLHTAYNFPMIPGTGLILIIILIFVVGIIARNLIGKHIIKLLDLLFHTVPIINRIYGSIKEISNSFLGTKEGKVFKKVALVDYPHKGVKALGFITNETTLLDTKDEDYVSIFLPTTPNPTSGFFLLYKKKDVTILDMSIENALKMIISSGAVEKMKK